MNIYISSDHAGFDLKEKIRSALLQNPKYHLTDHGPKDTTSVDYPDYADLVCQSLKKDSNGFGILICGSGQGMNIRANKYSFIRAALVYSDEIAKLSREHNNANVICIGARFCSFEDADRWINLFLQTDFAGGRHQTRVAKLGCPTA